MSGLLIKPETFRDRIESFNYDYLSFETRKLAAGASYQGNTGGNEVAIVWTQNTEAIHR